MGVHGKGQRGRTAVVAQDAQHRRQLIDVGAAAAELRRDAGLHQPGRLQQRKIVGDELVFIRGCAGALRKHRSEVARDVDDCAVLNRFGFDGFGCAHDIPPVWC
jgi:hypothetical protein